LAVDVETSGMDFSDDPSNGYQIVSIGLIVSDVKTLKELDSLYLEIQWNGEDKWDEGAEKIHGLSQKYLESNGIPEEDAVVEIAEFIMSHFDMSKAITLMGHNAANFDKPFMKKLFNKFGIPIKFSHRTIDSFTIGLIAVDAFDSDELFKAMSLPDRKTHNSLEDIRYTLKSIRIIKKLIKEVLSS
jgi:DNA polymerase III epsilon subunit-like protein